MKPSKIYALASLSIFLCTAFVFYPGFVPKKIIADKKKSEISYTMVHPLHEWTGKSHEVNCALIYNADENKIETVAVSMLLATFDSKNSNRDSHALETLDAIKYPLVKLTSSSIAQQGNELTINANLTFHNVTKPITVKATRSDEKNKIVVDGNFVVNITDYQIEVPSIMGLKTNEEITIGFKIIFPL